jgi:hypothetical protein
MVLDTIIFTVPMAVYLKPGISKKQIITLGALFTMGSVVVLMSVLRVWVTSRHKPSDPAAMVRNSPVRTPSVSNTNSIPHL